LGASIGRSCCGIILATAIPSDIDTAADYALAGVRLGLILLLIMLWLAFD
jgi:hypothetical protein